ncbi:hypothetical protein GGGNBK_01725 [Sporosarcina sp. ANT_H38]
MLGENLKLMLLQGSEFSLNHPKGFICSFLVLSVNIRRRDLRIY